MVDGAARGSSPSVVIPGLDPGTQTDSQRAPTLVQERNRAQQSEAPTTYAFSDTLAIGRLFDPLLCFAEKTPTSVQKMR